MTRALVFALLVATACGKPSGSAVAQSSPSASATSASSAAVTPSASSATVAASKTWRGTYKSSAAALEVPSDLVKAWAHADRDGGTGEGTMTLAIDGVTGRADGTLDGPLGPALVAGDVTSGTLTGALRRKDPSDRGFTGTLRATVSPDRIDGTMSLASANGAQQRTAAVTLSPAP